ncbi:MAG: SDH family Clp fold serine proteinase [Candidatus Rokuibacteriota bacterium]
MASWNAVRIELEKRPTAQGGSTDHDGFRREKYKAVEQITGRPLVVYATDFLNKEKVAACKGDVEIDLTDRDSIIEVTQELDGAAVDVLLYSPGGLPDAADSIVQILRSKFDDIRFIIPSVAKSAATMIALSGRTLVMEHNAELGPIDPQFRLVKADNTSVNAPAQAIIDQFEKAQDIIGKDPKKLAAWIPILQQYGPSLYQQCLNAIELSKRYVFEWLKTGMFRPKDGTPEALTAAEAAARKVVDYLGDHNQFKSHGARIGVQELRKVDVPVKILNEDKPLHEAVMTMYHALLLTFGGTGAFRIVENSHGAAFIRLVQTRQIVIGPGQLPPGIVPVKR